MIRYETTHHCNAHFTPPAGYDKTVLSVSCLVWRCELDECSDFKFSISDSLELSGNLIHAAEADATQTRQFCRV